MMGGEYPGLHMHLGLPEMDNTLAVTSMVPPLRIGPNGLPLLPGGGFVSGEARRPQRRKAPRDAWTDAEDAKLRSVVDNHRTPKQVMPGEKGPTSRIRWSQLAKMMPNRTGKQCRERWADHVDPQLKRVAWSAEEDETLFT